MNAAVPPEPDALRAELRHAAAERPEEADALVAAALHGYLGGSWQVAGADVDLLAQVLEGAHYETRLWVMGDRRWRPLVDTIDGRMRRRRHVAERAGAAPAGRGTVRRRP